MVKKKKVQMWQVVTIVILAIMFLGFMADGDKNYVAAFVTLVLLGVTVFWDKVVGLWKK